MSGPLSDRPKLATLKDISKPPPEKDYKVRYAKFVKYSEEQLRKFGWLAIRVNGDFRTVCVWENVAKGSGTKLTFAKIEDLDTILQEFRDGGFVVDRVNLAQTIFVVRKPDTDVDVSEFSEDSDF